VYQRREYFERAPAKILLMTTAHVTGNLAVLRKERRPVDVLGVARCDVPQGFASPAHIPWAGR
jgi:hypothetical protein